MTGIMTEGPEAPDSPAPFRYDYEIDRQGDSAQMRVVRLVGPGKRVLELGCGSGPMSQVLREEGCSIVGIELDPTAAVRARQHCERVIVGDLDHLDLLKVLEGDSFDAVVAADVLEHLKEPAAVLRSVRALLRAHGHVVALIPNVAHASVRLALLTGHFPYSDLGLLDRTHLRFYTRDSVESLFEESGYVIDNLTRNVVSLDDAEVPFDRSRIPADVLSAITAEPEALTYQFIVDASPQQIQEQNVNHVVSVDVDEMSRRFGATGTDNLELRAALDAIEQEAARLRDSQEMLKVKNSLANMEVAKHRQLLVEQAAQVDMMRSEVELLTAAKAEAYAMATLSMQLAEASKAEAALTHAALASVEEVLTSVKTELETALVERAEACRQRDAVRIALRRASTERAAGWDKLEDARAQLAAQVLLTEYWYGRYEGLRARIEAMLQRTGIASAVRLTPAFVRRFVKQRVLHAGRS